MGTGSFSHISVTVKISGASSLRSITVCWSSVHLLSKLRALNCNKRSHFVKPDGDGNFLLSCLTTVGVAVVECVPSTTFKFEFKFEIDDDGGGPGLRSTSPSTGSADARRSKKRYRMMNRKDLDRRVGQSPLRRPRSIQPPPDARDHKPIVDRYVERSTPVLTILKQAPQAKHRLRRGVRKEKLPTEQYVFTQREEVALVPACLLKSYIHLHEQTVAGFLRYTAIQYAAPFTFQNRIVWQCSKAVQIHNTRCLRLDKSESSIANYFYPMGEA